MVTPFMAPRPRRANHDRTIQEQMVVVGCYLPGTPRRNDSVIGYLNTALLLLVYACPRVGPASNISRSSPLVRSRSAPRRCALQNSSEHSSSSRVTSEAHYEKHHQGQIQPIGLRCADRSQLVGGWALVDTSSRTGSGSKAKHPVHHGR